MPVLFLARHSTCARTGASRLCRVLHPSARLGGGLYPRPVITNVVHGRPPRTITIIVFMNLVQVRGFLMTINATARL